MTGLFDKYIVSKASGEPVDEDACYFVLRYDTDPHARAALLAYADSIWSINPQLASDIRAVVTAICLAELNR